MKTSNKFLALCLGALVSVSAFAAGEMKHKDHSFVEKAAKAGMEEVAVSQVAVERATNPQVKEFAQMMVSDHSGANTELAALASSKGVTLPSPEKIHTEKWTSRSAKDFDHEYMEKMVSDHKDVVSLFEKQAKDGSDAELKAFAEKTLPALQAHLDKAKQVLAQVK